MLSALTSLGGLPDGGEETGSREQIAGPELRGGASMAWASERSFRRAPEPGAKT